MPRYLALAGLPGYRARPTAPEVIGYAAYPVAAGWLFFGSCQATPVGGAVPSQGPVER